MQHTNTMIINQVRQQLVEVSNRNKVPHLACSLSSVEILYSLYFHIMNIDPDTPDNPKRDRFLLGKGHAAAVLYSMLGHRGFFDVKEVFTLGQDGSAFEEHPGKNSPAGVENISGSLGHALGLATGMAKAAKLRNSPSHFYTLVGDGELNEGTNWEAALFAPAHNLDNLTVIVDFNKLQGTGRSCDIMQIENLEDKWRAFGWNTFRVNGHDVSSLNTVLNENQIVKNRPRAIVADTIKGAGISFMADDNNWHYRLPTNDEVNKTREELGLVEEAGDEK